MAELFTTVIHPSSHGPEKLTVRDAMQQVLDLIELLERAGRAESADGPPVIWRLNKASTNSPLSIQAEGSSSDSSISVAIRASSAKRIVANTLSSLMSHDSVPDWMDHASLKLAKRIFERNENGIGLTEVEVEDVETRIFITPSSARSACLVIDRALRTSIDLDNLSHTEFGAAEGDIIAATTYYGRPALMLRERLTGDRVTCVLSEEIADKVGLQQSLKTVWEGQRVVLSGALHYNEDGHIVKVDADDLLAVTSYLVDLIEVRKLDITRGKSPNDYLEYIRGIDLG